MKKKIVLLLIVILTICLFGCHQHEYGEWKTTKAATCLEEGIEERFCSCGQKETRTIDKTNHNYGSGVEVKTATCTDFGTVKYTCLVCGKTISETVSKIEHSYDAGTIISQPTCTQSGIKKYTCKVCGSTKNESIAALGHNPDNNYICQRCGAKCSVTINMSSSEKINAEEVSWLSQRDIYHDDDNNQYRLQFALMDSDKTEISTAAAVEIKIINDNNEQVYSAIKVVKASDFGTWTWASGTQQHYLATIYIKDSEITEGTSTGGTIYFTVYNNGYFSFDESTLSIDDLPLKGITLSLPKLPQTISYYRSSACQVNNISYDLDSYNTLLLYFTLEKTYDIDGSEHSSSCYIGWKLYDSDNYVVASGTYGTDALKVGDKIRNDKEVTYYNVEPGESYRLEIINVGH